MQKNRLEAFSDGVIAIIITIMVLELKVPHGTNFAALQPLLPVFLSYVLSFIYVGIYWNNHHHLLHATQKINGAHPVGESASPVLAVAVPIRHRLDGRKPFRCSPHCALRLRAPHVGHCLLHSAIVHRGSAGPRFPAGRRTGSRPERKTIHHLLPLAIGLSFVNQWLADALYVLVAIMWLIPDRRLERVVTQHPADSKTD